MNIIHLYQEIAPNTLYPSVPWYMLKVGIQPNECVYLEALAGPCQCQLGEMLGQADQWDRKQG